jgi:lysophospholipase L1-like esterase
MIDGNHPNPAGHAAIAAEALRVLRETGVLAALER